MIRTARLERKQQVNIRMSRAEKATLVRRAKQAERSLSKEVRYIIKMYLASEGEMFGEGARP